MKELKASLLANALFSAFTGISAAVFTQPFAERLGTAHVSILRVFGVSLVIHACILVWAHNRHSSHVWTRINLCVVAPYPFLMAALIAFGEISGTDGILIATMDGLIVGLIAIWQYFSLRNIGIRK